MLICTGCYLNSNRINSLYTINILTIIATQFLGRVFSNLLNFNANYIDLIHSTAIKHPISLSPTPFIYIQNSPISEIFQKGDAIHILEQYSFSNATQHIFNFYTDGSVINIGTDRCTMSIE